MLAGLVVHLSVSNIIRACVCIVHSVFGIDVESIVFHEHFISSKEQWRIQYRNYFLKYDYASFTKWLIESVRAGVLYDVHTMRRGNHSKCTAKVFANVIVQVFETVIVERHCNRIRLVHLSSKNHLPFTTSSLSLDHLVTVCTVQFPSWTFCTPFSIKTPGVNF